jgi:UDP-glucose 4-epimerase
VARANALAIESEVPNGAYNIGTGVETEVNELCERLRRISGKDLPLSHGPGKPGEQLRSCIDPSKAARLLGWRSKVSLADGLEETLRFFGAR